MDGAIAFGLVGKLTTPAPNVDRATAAANAGVGAIEVGRGGILFCAADTDGVGAADCGRGGRFVEAVCCCGASLPTTG